MCTAGWAFAWDFFWGRRRILTTLTLAWLVVLAVVVQVLPAGPQDVKVIGPLSIPLWSLLVVLAALFSHGDQADILARDSGYPRRLFTLPLPTAALAGWPLVLGGGALALLWLPLAGLILRPVGLAVPLEWGAVFLVALLAWLQALTWFPFPLPALRLLVAVPVLGALTTGALLGFFYEVSPALLLGVSAALVPAGYLVAVLGLARARRGDVAVWSWPVPRLGWPAFGIGRSFASAIDAQLWLEWRRNGFVFPLLVALPVVPHLFLMYRAATPREAGLALVGLAIYPILMATGAGIGLSNTHPWSRRIAALPAFVAARPVTTAALVAVKLRLAVRSTLAAWAVVVLALLLTLPFSLLGEMLAGWTRRLIETQGPRGWALLALIVLGLPLLTWKWLVNQLWIGLSGRHWLEVFAGLAIPVSLTGLGLFTAWFVTHREWHPALLDAVPWVVGALLALKVAGGVLVGRALLRRELVSGSFVAAFALAWLAAAVGLIGLTCWLLPAEVYSPWVVGAGAVLLALPLVRLGLAPLALAWGRHR
jgi:hypothetical protein